jgi:hypothetical protein
MDSEEKNIKKYENALSLLFYEGEIAWQLNLVYIAINVGLAALIGNQINISKSKPDFHLIIYGFLGVIFTVLWLGTFYRNNKFYNFRMAQAREVEPPDWELLRKRGYKFSRGEKITINDTDIENKDKDHKLNRFESLASNKSALKWVIYIIILAYLMLICLQFFH